mgnify:CR=1 FL=1
MNYKISLNLGNLSLKNNQENMLTSKEYLLPLVKELSELSDFSLLKYFGIEGKPKKEHLDFNLIFKHFSKIKYSPYIITDSLEDKSVTIKILFSFRKSSFFLKVIVKKNESKIIS